MRSSASAMAVSRRIGVRLVFRNDRVKSKPFSPGIMTSRTTRSNSMLASLPRASAASPAIVTRNPLPARYRRSNSRIRASSSTTRRCGSSWFMLGNIQGVHTPVRMLSVKERAQLARQLIALVRLADEVDALVKTSVMDDRILGIARGEEHLEPGLHAHRAFHHLLAGHRARHHDIGEKQRHLVGLEGAQRLIWARRFDHRVAQIRQHADDRGPHIMIVFDDEDGLITDRRQPA